MSAAILLEEEGLGGLVEATTTKPARNGPYVKKREMLVDPWGHPYAYRIPGEHGEYDLDSAGADPAAGGHSENQDIGNW